jgi:hypothetical protein
MARRAGQSRYRLSGVLEVDDRRIGRCGHRARWATRCGGGWPTPGSPSLRHMEHWCYLILEVDGGTGETKAAEVRVTMIKMGHTGTLFPIDIGKGIGAYLSRCVVVC